MKLIKKLLAFIFISGIFQTAIFALDGGALIYNDTSFKTNRSQNYYLNQKDVVTAWMKIPFGNNSENYFIAEGLYKFESNANLKAIYNYIDLNLFKATYTFHFDEALLKIDGGRFFTSSLSPVVYSQNADGLKVLFKNDILSASAYFAYTGLLNGNVVKMIRTIDFNDVNTNDVYHLADKYFITAETISFENLFANQNLAAQFTGAFRINEVEDTKLFATLLLNGPIVNNLIYNLDATVEFSKYSKHDMVVSLLARFILGYYFDNGSITGNVIFASKDFNAISSYAALDNLNEPEYTGILKPGLSGTFKPLENLMISASADIAFDVKKSYELKGFQYKIGVDYQVLSDVYVGIIWNQYFDLNNSDVNYGCASAQVKIAF